MLEKQKQSVGNNSTAIQVQGDLHIGAMTYQEIKAIFLDLFQLNFPKLQEIAKATATERVNVMLERLKISLDKHSQDLDLLRFSEPSIQYEMQGIATDVARRGDKSNVDLLCELLCIQTSKNCPELIELVASEARKIIPFLSRAHIDYISLLVVFYEAQLDSKTIPTNDAAILNNVDRLLSGVLPYVKGASELKISDLQFIAYLGATSDLGFSGKKYLPRFVNESNFLKDLPFDRIRRLCQNGHMNNVLSLLNISERLHFSSYKLSAVGRLIGWMNLNNSGFSNADLNKVFS